MSRLFRISLLISVFFGLEKVLGFLRQALIARQFGLSAELDVFNAANNIPDLLFYLISGGALTVALIPILAGVQADGGRPAAWRVLSQTANLLFLITAVLALLVAVFAEPLVNSQVGIAPGFSADQRTLVADLMRWNLIATLLFSLGGLSTAGLHTQQHFFLPALAPALYDVGTIIGVLTLAPSTPYTFGPVTLPALGWGVHGLVAGTILGAGMYFGIQIPGLLRHGFAWTPAIDLTDTAVRRVLSVAWPRIRNLLYIQILFIAQDNLASRLPVGSVSALAYGWLFMQMPATLLGTAIATALLPTLAEQFAAEDQSAFRQTMQRATAVLTGLTIPLAVLVGVVIEPAVGLLGFEGADAALIAWTSRGFLVGMLGHGLMELIVRAIYTRQQPLLAVRAAFIATLAYLPIGFGLSQWLGAPGLGLANAIVVTGQGLALYFIVSRQFGETLLPEVRVWGRSAIAAVLGGLAAAMLLWLAPTGGTLLQVTMAGVALVLGALVVLPFVWRNELSALLRL